MLDQTIQRKLECAGQQLPLQIHRDKTWADVDVLVSGHPGLRKFTSRFDLDICIGSMDDARMNGLFLQLR